jgi:hypothetical protein
VRYGSGRLPLRKKKKLTAMMIVGAGALSMNRPALDAMKFFMEDECESLPCIWAGIWVDRRSVLL